MGATQRTVTTAQARELAKQAKARTRAQRQRDLKDVAESRRLSMRVSTEPVTVRLPFPPLLNRYYRTAVVGKHASTYISKDGKAYRKQVVELWREVGVTFEGQLALRITATYPDNRRRDIDGLPKAIMDSLEAAGAFEDDSQIRLLIVEQEAVEAPGWVEVTLGPKPDET